MPPLDVVGAQGCRLTLADGRSVIDGIASWWCKSLGHGHPHLRAALHAQADKFEHVIAAHTTHAGLVRLCERLLALANGLPVAHWGQGCAAGRLPGHFGKVFLAGDGSTGVEVAMKMALQAQAQRGQAGRVHFAALENGYHGETIATLSVGDLGLYSAPYEALMFPVEKIGPLPYRTGPSCPQWMDCDQEWAVIEAKLNLVAPTLAAIVYEPVLQAACGMRLYSPALLSRLCVWAQAHGVFLIADEIASGLWRLGAPLASHLAPGNMLPDFVVLSKGLTGGFMPLSAVLTTDDIFGLFDGEWNQGRSFLHSNTYTANALAVAVANAALDVYAASDFSGGLMESLAQSAFSSRPCLRNARALGMVAAVDLVDRSGRPFDAGRRTGRLAFKAALERGALLRPLGDTLYLFPPLTISPEDLDVLFSILCDSAASVC